MAASTAAGAGSGGWSASATACLAAATHSAGSAASSSATRSQATCRSAKAYEPPSKARRTSWAYAAWLGAARAARSTSSRRPRVPTPAARKSAKGVSSPSGKEGEVRAGLPHKGIARHQGPGGRGAAATSATAGRRERAACRRRRGGGSGAMAPGTVRPGNQESRPAGGRSCISARAMHTQGGQASEASGAEMRRTAQQAWRAEMCECQGSAPKPPSAGRPNRAEWCRPAKARPVACGERARSTNPAVMEMRRSAIAGGGWPTNSAKYSRRDTP